MNGVVGLPPMIIGTGNSVWNREHTIARVTAFYKSATGKTGVSFDI